MYQCACDNGSRRIATPYDGLCGWSSLTPQPTRDTTIVAIAGINKLHEGYLSIVIIANCNYRFEDEVNCQHGLKPAASV